MKTNRSERRVIAVHNLSRVLTYLTEKNQKLTVMHNGAALQFIENPSEEIRRLAEMQI